ncbi:MAG: isoprenyl transferase [Desulfobacterales bacterium]|nr:isoprenyl transferase [Desulfobacterales bacterium]
MLKKKKKSSKFDTVMESPLNPKLIPAHVALIMDGNGRWAQKRLMNRVRGHERGTETVREVVRTANDIGVDVLTLYAFSTENWGRPKLEVSALMKLLKSFMIKERRKMMEKGIRLNILGQIDKLPKEVRREAEETMTMTRDNRTMTLNLALSYGGRQDITRAAQQLAAKVAAGDIAPEEITEEMVSDHLYTAGMPDPDLIIRTSGEFRLSNFLMWQAAYSEIFITPTLWPDFSRAEFIDILKKFQERDRRFGKVACNTSNDGSLQ